MVSFQALHWKTVALHVGVGMGAASFWRGAWYVLDDHLFPDQPGRSALASLLLGSAGMAASQGLMQKCEDMALQQQRTMTSVLAKTSHQRQQMMLLRLARFGAVYTVALSVVLVWRGTWIGWDVLYEHFHNRHHTLSSSQHQQQQDDFASAAVAGVLPLHQHSVSMVKSTDPGHLTQSGIASHLAAVTILLGAGLFASVLAPPAAISVIRDATVHAAAATSKAAVAMRSTTQAPAYQGPATNVLAAFLSPSEMGASPSLTAASTMSHHPRGAMVTAPATAARPQPAHTLIIKPVSITQLPKATPFLVSGHLTETMKHRTRM